MCGSSRSRWVISNCGAAWGCMHSVLVFSCGMRACCGTSALRACCAMQRQCTLAAYATRAAIRMSVRTSLCATVGRRHPAHTGSTPHPTHCMLHLLQPTPGLPCENPASMPRSSPPFHQCAATLPNANRSNPQSPSPRSHTPALTLSPQHAHPPGVGGEVRGPLHLTRAQGGTRAGGRSQGHLHPLPPPHPGAR